MTHHFPLIRELMVEDLPHELTPTGLIDAMRHAWLDNPALADVIAMTLESGGPIAGCYLEAAVND